MASKIVVLVACLTLVNVIQSAVVSRNSKRNVELNPLREFLEKNPQQEQVVYNLLELIKYGFEQYMHWREVALTNENLQSREVAEDLAKEYQRMTEKAQESLARLVRPEAV